MPRGICDFSPIDSGPGILQNLTFDFTHLLGKCEIIETTSWQAQSTMMIDPAPSGILQGGAVVQGPYSVQQVGNGVAGEIYRVIAYIKTNAQETLLYCHLPCLAPD